MRSVGTSLRLISKNGDLPKHNNLISKLKMDKKMRRTKMKALKKK